MSVKIIHTADIHIGMEFKRASFGSKLGNRRRNEIKETFYKILNRVEQENVDLLLISGDLFEDEFITIGELKEINGKFSKLNTKIFIIAGNHDPIINNKSNYNLIQWSNNVYIFNTFVDKVSIEELNVDIYGLSWNRKHIEEKLFEQIEVQDKTRINILLAHGDIYGESKYLPIDKINLLKKGFDYVALGHIHKHDFIESNIAYPGSPEPLDFSETGKHGILEGAVGINHADIKFIPFSKREFKILELNVHEDMTLEDIIDLILNMLENEDHSNLYRVIVKGCRDKDIKIDADYIKEKVESVIEYIEVKDETTLNYNLDSIKKENNTNIIGQFIDYMEQRGLEDEIVKDALYEGLETLLSEKVN